MVCKVMVSKYCESNSSFSTTPNRQWLVIITNGVESLSNEKLGGNLKIWL